MKKYINIDKVSEYGKQQGFVDYGYLANHEVDSMILANNMEMRLFDTLELESGDLYLNDAEYDSMVDIFQWFIVDGGSAKRLKEYDEIVFYDNELDIYIWGITHWGTRWDYVLTNVALPTKGDN